MSVPVVRPISEMSRVQEHGRIRFGIKNGKFPKAIDTFRFTSPDEEAIEQIAEVYGGTVKPWSDRSARIQNQYEVITESNVIDVWVPPDSVSATYESWTAAGCQRRCDGEMVTILDVEEPQPCLCLAKNLRECKPKTRFNVVLPAIDFGGVWRGESGSWDAMEEMQSMMSLIDAVRDAGQPFLICRLILQDMKKTKQGETHRWKYPKLVPTDSMENIVTGATRFTALTQGADGRVHPQLVETTERISIEAHSVEAQIVSENMPVGGMPGEPDAEYIEYAEVIEEPSSTSWATIADATKAGMKRDQIEKIDGRWITKTAPTKETDRG